MKKTMNLLIVVFTVLAIIGYVFKLLHLPGAGILIVSSAAILILLLFNWFIRKKSGFEEAALFLFGVIFLASFSFKLMKWSGFEFIDALLPFFSLVLLGVFLTKRD